MKCVCYSDEGQRIVAETSVILFELLHGWNRVNIDYMTNNCQPRISLRDYCCSSKCHYWFCLAVVMCDCVLPLQTPPTYDTAYQEAPLFVPTMVRSLGQWVDWNSIGTICIIRISYLRMYSILRLHAQLMCLCNN